MFFENRTEDIYIVRNKSRFSYPIHIHHNVEVTICTSGEVSAECNGVSKILHSGDFVIAFHNDTHSYGISENASHIMLFFNPDISDVMKNILGKYTYENFGTAKEVIPLLDALCDEFYTDKNFPVMYGYLHASVGLLLKNLSHTEKSAKIEKGLFENALKYISENYTNSVSLKSLAKHLGVDSCHLSREFKKRTPDGFYGYLQQLRLERAKNLLQNSDLTIYEILLESGFSNQRTFNRVFKNSLGVTPKEYRKSRPLYYEVLCKK